MCLSLSERKTEQLPCEQSLQGFGFSQTFLPPVSHGDKSGLFQNPVKVAYKAVVLIFSFTLEYFTLKKNCLLSPRHTLYLIHGLLPGQNQLSQQNVTKVYKNSKKQHEHLSNCLCQDTISKTSQKRKSTGEMAMFSLQVSGFCQGRLLTNLQKICFVIIFISRQKCLCELGCLISTPQKNLKSNLYHLISSEDETKILQTLISDSCRSTCFNCQRLIKMNLKVENSKLQRPKNFPNHHK